GLRFELAPPAPCGHRSAQAHTGLSPSLEGDSFSRGGDSSSRGGRAATAREARGAAPAAAFSPEDVFHYVYGLFHAPSYRDRYADFLRSEFPRVLLPPSADAFRALADVGRRLTALHLLHSVTGSSVDYPATGDHVVAKGFPAFFAPDEEGPDG